MAKADCLVHRILAVVGIIILVAAPLRAGSIFSANGIGEELVGGGARTQGLAGGGMALADSMSFNTRNPALAAFLTHTTLRMGGEVGWWTTTDVLNRKDTDSEFLWRDFALYFPLTRAWKIGLGAEPTLQMDALTIRQDSAVFHPVFHDTLVGDLVAGRYELRSHYRGSATNLRLDNAWKVSDKFALGLSTQYILLRNERSRNLNMPEIQPGSYYFNVNYDESQTFRGWSFTLGGHYKINHDLEVSAAYRPRFTGHWHYELVKVGSDSAQIRDRDGHSPGRVNLGAAYRFSNAMILTADVQAEQWEKGDLGILVDPSSTVKPVNPLFVSVGVERVAGKSPQQTGFRLVGVRGGLYYRKHYWPEVNGQAVEDIGLTGGMSLPVAASAGWLHVAIEAGLRGLDKSKLGARETFLRTSLQLEMGETWFQRTRPRAPK
jgi:hypothetical protein